MYLCIRNVVFHVNNLVFDSGLVNFDLRGLIDIEDNDSPEVIEL